jgi:Ca2+-transporting ATPase
VPAAIAECHAAGIRVVMITGDHPETARSIARQIGLGRRDAAGPAVLTGAELDRLSDEALGTQVRQVEIFARVVPEQKLRIVRALQARGEVVAMTGDGVNDAPALKAADIGVAMGGQGTDVAREASGLVLLDDELSTLVTAIRLGRRLFDNLRNALAYVFAVHVPIAGLTILPVLVGVPPMLLPVHIALLHLLIEPGCSVVVEAEPEDPEVMRRPPRDPRARLFGRSLVVGAVRQGAPVLVLLLGLYLGALHQGQPANAARGLALVGLSPPTGRCCWRTGPKPGRSPRRWRGGTVRCGRCWRAPARCWAW